jgi:hypothetical protein
MLKVILIIQCDTCANVFHRTVTSCDRNPKAWDYLESLLSYNAEQRCWGSYRNEHYCPSCMLALTLPLPPSGCDTENAEYDDCPF